MRELLDHKVNPVNDKLTVSVVDEPGSGGANHHYEISGFTHPWAELEAIPMATTLRFQKGPISEAGVNGVTHEALIAIVLDRLRSFDQGPFRSRDNSLAITHLEDALMRLHNRTLERMRRGVEGTNKL